MLNLEIGFFRNSRSNILFWFLWADCFCFVKLNTLSKREKNYLYQHEETLNCLQCYLFYKYLQAALVICSLFICDFAYMRSRNGLFSGTYPLIYSNPWSFYMQIRYMRAYFWSPYLSHLTRSTCTLFPEPLWYQGE